MGFFPTAYSGWLYPQSNSTSDHQTNCNEQKLGTKNFVDYLIVSFFFFCIITRRKQWIVIKTYTDLAGKVAHMFDICIKLVNNGFLTKIKIQ